MIFEMAQRKIQDIASEENPQSVIDEIQSLQSQIDAKKESAIQALLGQRKHIDDLLTSLGHADAARAVSGRIPGVRRSKAPGEQYCKYCEIHGHDARRHKGQSEKKKFSKEELAAL